MRSWVMKLGVVTVICASVVSCAPGSTAAPSPVPAATVAQPGAAPTTAIAIPQPSPTAGPDVTSTVTPGPVPVVTVAADPASPRATIKMASFSFSPSSITGRVGQPIHLTLDNGDNIFHQFAIDNSDVDVQVAPGTVQKVDLVFSKAGTYVFACNLTEEGNHRGSGMVGTIVLGP